MNYLVTIIVLNLSLTCSPKSIYTNCDSGLKAIVDPNNNELIYIKESIDGVVLDSMRNDIEEEDFLNLIICEVQMNYFNVVIWNEIARDTLSGWIANNGQIGSYLKHEEYPTMDLVLYSDSTLADSFTINEYSPGFLSFIRFNKNAVLVRIIHNGRSIEGWILIDRLCPNSYSTCS